MCNQYRTVNLNSSGKCYETISRISFSMKKSYVVLALWQMMVHRMNECGVSCSTFRLASLSSELSSSQLRKKCIWFINCCHFRCQATSHAYIHRLCTIVTHELTLHRVHERVTIAL